LPGLDETAAVDELLQLPEGASSIETGDGTNLLVGQRAGRGGVDPAHTCLR